MLVSFTYIYLGLWPTHMHGYGINVLCILYVCMYLVAHVCSAHMSVAFE